MEEELFVKKISKEEKIYKEAVELQNAVSCVLRFERRVSALNSAADKFERLGDYKDAGERMKACREQAVKEDADGAREVYELALSKKEAAAVKSEYADAIAEFRRVRKREEYKESVKEQVQECKRQIAKLESRAVWKRRLTAVVVLVICAFLFAQTPAYPFAKGVVHQQMGEYRAAIQNFEDAEAISWSADMKSSCYYHLGMKKLEQGNEKAAMKLFRKAKGNKAAKKQIKELKKQRKNEDEHDNS